MHTISSTKPTIIRLANYIKKVFFSNRVLIREYDQDKPATIYNHDREHYIKGCAVLIKIGDYIQEVTHKQAKICKNVAIDFQPAWLDRKSVV